MPKIKLTKTIAAATLPANHVYEIRDTSVPGFLLKVMPTG